MATRRYRPRSCEACKAAGKACGDHGSFYEPRDMTSFVNRIARAMVNRAIAGGDSEVLVAIRAMRAALDQAEIEVGRALYYGSVDPDPADRGRWGWAWSELAREVGITRQAAEQRYGVRTQLPRNRSQGPDDHAAAS